MKSYLDLVPQYEKVHRKNSRISVICITLAVCLVTAIFSMADMANRMYKEEILQTYGGYHIDIADIDTKTAELVSARVDVAFADWLYMGSTGTIGVKNVTLAGMEEEAFTSLTNLKLLDGVYPAKTDEALLNETACKQLALSIGDTVSITLPGGGEESYLITGIFEDTSILAEKDAYGLVLNQDGLLCLPDMVEAASYRVRFKDGVMIQKAIADMKDSLGLADSQVRENTYLLGVMGQSGNVTMEALYTVAAILMVLVLTAGVVMISASFNTNVKERMQFYGLLRCLGASRKQVRHFVVLQGLRQSMKGVPLGLIVGMLFTWGACWLLRTFTPKYFGEFPLFQISWIGLTAGILVGFLIVLLASLSPARKAAGVSPVVAVNGNAQIVEFRRAASTKGSVETGMGFFHATCDRKNIVLMTCSFAISIVMFLSFRVLVDFMHQALPAVNNTASDLSVSMNPPALDAEAFAGQVEAFSDIKEVQVVEGEEQTTVKIWLTGKATDDTIEKIRSLMPTDASFSDKRSSNAEARSTYYIAAVFIYGFLLVIALITVFNIFNTMNASVSSRTRQYGVMRAIGMGTNQLRKMIVAEAFTYASLGCVTGCILGLPANMALFNLLITRNWGFPTWRPPVASLVLIVFICAGSAVLSIRRPIRQISNMVIVDTIKSQQ